MNEKLSNWLKIEIKIKGLGSKRRVPSARSRMIGKVLQVLVVLVICAFVIWRIVLYQEVNAQLARIQSAGLPVSGAELNSWRPKVPDEENGALVMAEAFDLLNVPSGKNQTTVFDHRLIGRTNLWDESTRELILTCIQTNQPALAMAREALEHSKFQYPVDLSYGPSVELPHLRKLKNIAHIAALQSIIQAEQGRTDEWVTNTMMQLSLARTLDEEPILISHLVWIAVIQQAAKATERNLNQGSPTAAQCELLQDAFIRAAETNLLPRALIGERAIAAPVFRMSWKEIQHLSKEEERSEPKRFEGKPAPLLWLSGFLERDLNFFLQTMDKGISLASLPCPQSLALTNHYESTSETARKRVYFLSSMVLPTFSRAIVREATTRALTEMSATALAVERFRQERGELPASLEQLTPKYLKKIPIDPFDGAPLRYKVLPRGYLLYSVDADRHDDLGREKPERKKSTDTNSYDLTFIVER